AVVVDLLQKLAAAFVVPFLAGLDEVVVADLQGAPDFLELAGHVVAVGLGIFAHLGGALGDLDGVLIVAPPEMGLAAFHAAVAGLDVGADLLEGGADVRATIGVVDGRGLIETCWIGHDRRGPRNWGDKGRTPSPSLHTRTMLSGHGFGGGRKAV